MLEGYRKDEFWAPSFVNGVSAFGNYQEEEEFTFLLELTPLGRYEIRSITL